MGAWQPYVIGAQNLQTDRKISLSPAIRWARPQEKRKLSSCFYIYTLSFFSLFNSLSCISRSFFPRLQLLLAMATAASFLLSFSKAPHRTAPPRRLPSQGTWKVRRGITIMRADSVERTRVSVGEKKDLRPIIVIDNYDSFTYNLCQYIGELGVHFEVFRNDELTVEEIRRKNPRGILISPGPGMPQDSGISLQTVVELGPSMPLFGVCMGLQCIGEAFGGKIVRAPSGVRHGKSSFVYYDEKLGESLFDGLPNPFSACRYHSLVIEKNTFPSDKLEVTAWTDDGLIMAARHKHYKHIKGVQFHPESIITPEGKMMILNFIKFVDNFQA